VGKRSCPRDFVEVYNTLKESQKLSVNALSVHYGVYYGAIHIWLKQHDLHVTKANTKYEDLIDMTSFRNDAESGNFTIKTLAEKYQISKPTELCKRNGIQLCLKPSAFQVSDPSHLIEMIRTQGKTVACKEYDTTLSSLNWWCSKNGVETEKHIGLKRRDVDEKTPEIIRLYRSGYSIGELATFFSTSSPKIKRLLESHNVILRKNSFEQWDEQRAFIQSKLADLYQQIEMTAKLYLQ
jgi:hypothetical protein